MGNLENVATRVVMLICEGLLTGFILFLFANSFLQKAAESQALFKINADEKLVEKVLKYLQGMTEVKAYHLTGQKSRALNGTGYKVTGFEPVRK